MKIALVQANPTVGAISRNSSLISRYYRSCQEQGARLVVFPELAVTGFPLQDLVLYRSFAAEAMEAVTKKLAPLTAGENPALLLGAPWLGGGGLYNAALLLEKGSARVVCAKPLAAEGGRAPIDERPASLMEGKSEALLGIRAEIAVVEEIQDYKPFSDVSEGSAAEAGGPRGDIQLLIALSASPYYLGKQALREKAAAALSRKLSRALIFLNQVGGNDELIFDGTSLVYNNRGELLRRGASFREEVIWLRGEELFRPAQEMPPPLEENWATVYRALRLGLKDYLHKSGFKKALLGLSGGIDSAVTAALAADALGPENVLGVIMPSPYTPDHAVKDALELARNLGIEQRLLPIDGLFHSFLQLLNPEGGCRGDLAEENLQARIRGNILMFIANRERYMLLTTGNKSELAVGYCTMYGDMAGGLGVLADLPKLAVYSLAEHINRRHGKEVIPRNTMVKPPSAELRPDQKDEDSLPPYRGPDPILELYLEERLSPGEIIARGYPEETVKKVCRLVDRAEYKRRQAAPGLRVTSRTAPLAGRRMPIARGGRDQD